MNAETLNIIGDKITTSEPLKSKFSGNIDTYQLQVSFDSVWDGLVKFAAFEINSNPYVVEIVDDTIAIPSEAFVDPCECTIGFYGTNLNDDIKRISTNKMSFTVRQGAYVEGGTTPTVPTPSVWEVYLAEIKGYSDTAVLSATTAAEKEQSVLDAKDAIDTIKTHIDQQKTATDINATNAKASEDNAKVSEDNSKTSELTSSQALADLLALLGNKVATLDDNGKLTGSQIPDLSIINSHLITSVDELITLNAQLGDMAYIKTDNVVTDVYWLVGTDSSVAGNWIKFGVSFVKEAGNAQTALYAENSERINGHRLVRFDTVEEMEIAVKTDDDLYFAPYV